MRIRLNTIIALLLFTGISFAQNTKNFIAQPYIEVTGQFETEIIPNEIYLSIEQQENQMIAILKSLKIDLDKNFSILDFNGYYKRKILADDKVTKKKSYELIINDGETLGKIYQALDRIDVSNIYIIKTSHSDIEKIRRGTKLKALKAAKEKANDYATAINQTIGKALFIQEQTPNEHNNINNVNGYVNGVFIRGVSSIYGAGAIKEEIQDLNLTSITITASVMAKFILN